jgi:hypothetical protein
MTYKGLVLSGPWTEGQEPMADLESRAFGQDSYQSILDVTPAVISPHLMRQRLIQHLSRLPCYSSQIL